MITFTTDIVDWDSNASVTTKEPIDPALTYVTYANGITKSYDLSGVIGEDEGNGYVTPSCKIDDPKEAVKVKIGNQVKDWL